MKCPNCYADDNTVVDTRARKVGQKRIRKCNNCGMTFRTVEQVYRKPRITEKPLPMWYVRQLEKEKKI